MGWILKSGNTIELIKEWFCIYRFWPAIVSNNFGGMLGLTFVVDDGWKADEGFIPSSHADLKPDVTLFYLSPRIFPKGFAKKAKEKFTYQPPLHILSKNPNIDIKACMEWFKFADGPPSDICSKMLEKLENVPKSIKNGFKLGGEIEIIHPRTQKTIERALVFNAKVENYFLVQLIDDSEDCRPVVRHCLSSDILPSGWSDSMSANIKPSNKHSKYKPIPKKYFPKFEELAKPFACQQKLEVALDNGEFHSGTIIEIKEHILVIQLDSDNQNEQDLFLAPNDSLNIFPLGWTHTNDLPLMIPHSFLNEIEPDNKSLNEATKHLQNKEASKPECMDVDQISSWCPEIYFNYKCYSASFLSKARLASLPRSVGPGMVQLVMREVISLLVGSSYKSGSILKRLECKNEIAKKDFVIEEVKGKSRVLNLKANIEIPTKTYQVEKMCKEVCQRVGACPNLVSMQRYLTEKGCPADCQNRPKSNFLLNEEDNSYVDDALAGNFQGVYQKTLIPGLSATTGMGVKRRRDGRRKKRTNPDRLLIAEHNQLKRQRSRDQMTNEIGSSDEASSYTSDLEDAYAMGGTSLASTCVSSRTDSRSNSPNSQIMDINNEIPMMKHRKIYRNQKKGRGRKEWERY